MARIDELINGIPLEKMLDREASTAGVPLFMSRGYAKKRVDMQALPKGFAPKPRQLTKARRRKS